MEDDPRRLPVYFLLDTSESMASEVFVAVTEAMAAIVGQMKQDPMALETASLSVITFDRTASRLVMPTDLAQFHQPKLKRGPGRALGEALHLCLDCIRREVRRPTPKRRGDWEPICFLLIGGEPTDNWHEIARELHFGGYETTIRSAVLVVVVCGPQVNANIFRGVTDQSRVLERWPSEAVAGLWKDVYDKFVAKLTRSSKVPQRH